MRKQLRIQRQLLILLNLLHETSGAIRTNLRKTTQIPLIEPQRNDRVAAALATLIHKPTDGVVARVIQLAYISPAHASTRRPRPRPESRGGRQTIFVNHRSSPPAILFSTIPRPAAQLRERTVMP